MLEYEWLWRASFAIFLGALPLGAAHAIIQTALRRTGGRKPPAWLVWLRRGVNAVIAAGFVAISATIVARWLEAGYPPFSNMPESLQWVAWGLCALYLVCRVFTDLPGLEAGTCLGVVAILALSSRFDHAARPLVPALQSNWLVFHVLTCMIAYSAFFAAFFMAVLWLAIWRKREAGRVVDALTHQTMAFGFVLLTVGIIAGAVWAGEAWGRYWGWDPKETWSLITWLVYGIYLHFRRSGGWFRATRERLPFLNALFAILGFAVTLFTYFGVSYLLPSLHSYGSG